MQSQHYNQQNKFNHRISDTNNNCLRKKLSGDSHLVNNHQLYQYDRPTQESKKGLSQIIIN